MDINRCSTSYHKKEGVICCPANTPAQQHMRASLGGDIVWSLEILVNGYT